MRRYATILSALVLMLGGVHANASEATVQPGGSAGPDTEVATPDASSEEVPEPEVTCDLIGGIAGDRLCAINCISLRRGYRGGYCDRRKVCRCRR